MPAVTKEKLAYNRAYYARKGHIKRREYNLRAHYGMTIAEFEALMKKQHGRCAICSIEEWATPHRFHVDHNHRTGKVRALLCQKCNVAVGLCDDDPVRLERAAEYIRQHERL